MRGKLDWADNCECDWSFLSHEVSYFKGLGITKEDLVDEGVPVISYGQIHSKTNDGMHLRRDLLRYIPRTLTEGNENCRLRRGDIVFADTSELATAFWLIPMTKSMQDITLWLRGQRIQVVEYILRGCFNLWLGEVRYSRVSAA